MTKKIISLIASVCVAMGCLCGLGCGGGEKDKIELLVDLHGWMPTINTEPTISQPNVFQSPQLLANEFTKLYPNITVKWARNKPVGGTLSDFANYFTTQIQQDNCPAIAFTWGTSFQERDWYVDLASYLEQPNIFEEGNVKWKDSFEDYLWNYNTIATVDGKIAAVPLVLYPGTASAVYYNKDAFAKAGIETTPKTWLEYRNAARAASEAGYIPIDSSSESVEFGNWINQFNLGPSYMEKLRPELDTNNDGVMTGLEILKGVKAGRFNPAEHADVRSFMQELKSYYTEMLDMDLDDHKADWRANKVAMREDGIWYFTTETSDKAKDFEWGIFPAPIISTDSNEYVADVQYQTGPYKPAPDLQLNIMKPAVKDNPELLDAAVKFLMYLTTKEANGMMVVEQDSGLGAVKGAAVPSVLKKSNYLKNQFPMVETVSFPSGYTSQYSAEIDANFDSWVKDLIGDDVFFRKFNESQQKGADAYIANLNITL